MKHVIALLTSLFVLGIASVVTAAELPAPWPSEPKFNNPWLAEWERE